MSNNESIVVKKKKAHPKRRKERFEPHFLPVELREQNFRETNLGYISFDEFLAEADRCIQCGKPKCVEGCPANFNVIDMIVAIKDDNIDKALELLYGTYCFPQSIDRICPKFCEQNCVLGKKGDSIQIMYLKRYLADNFAQPDSYFEKEKATGKNIAVIGSGPAGLTAGYYIAKLGHNVVIFEKSRIYGGMLTLGIPEYRLPRNIINEEIKSMKKYGINFANNFTYGKDFDHKMLFNAGYDAILIAHGAHKPKWMGLEGEQTLEGSLHVVDYLRDYELDIEKANIVKGKKLAIIGGGDTAIDAARVSKRLGADSMIIYRRSREEMPAEEIEVDETDAEGIPINILTNPVGILHDGKKVTGLKVIKMELGEPDDSGRRRPVEIPGSEYSIDIDIIIQAISQEPDNESFPEEYKMSKWKTFEVNEETMETNVPGLYAAGDNVSGPSTAVNAIAHAHKAVKNIHEYVMSK